MMSKQIAQHGKNEKWINDLNLSYIAFFVYQMDPTEETSGFGV